MTKREVKVVASGSGLQALAMALAKALSGDDEPETPEQIAEREKLKRMRERREQFVEMLGENPRFSTTIVPIPLSGTIDVPLGSQLLDAFGKGLELYTLIKYPVRSTQYQIRIPFVCLAVGAEFDDMFFQTMNLVGTTENTLGQWLVFAGDQEDVD